jgi:hypothetical protein
MVAKHEKMRKMDSWNLISLNKQGLNIRANKRGNKRLMDYYTLKLLSLKNR